MTTQFHSAKQLARSGDAKAQYSVGMSYVSGKNGASKNPKEGVKWVQRAAEQGLDLAQCSMGVFYVGGNGVKQDFREAAKWYAMAAEQGHPEAQFNLAGLLQMGQGVPRNPEKSMKLIKLASAQGHGMANMMLKGLGVDEVEPEDSESGFNWGLVAFLAIVSVIAYLWFPV